MMVGTSVLVGQEHPYVMPGTELNDQIVRKHMKGPELIEYI